MVEWIRRYRQLFALIVAGTWHTDAWQQIVAPMTVERWERFSKAQQLFIGAQVEDLYERLVNPSS
jgi:hypothetical protein